MSNEYEYVKWLNDDVITHHRDKSAVI